MNILTYESSKITNKYFHGEPLIIGNATQLFIDDIVVESILNVQRVQQKPSRYIGNPIIIADRPWEKGKVLGPCVLYDDEESIYKMWYWGFDTEAYFLGMDLSKGQCVYYMMYAESFDGLNWVKPELDIIPFGNFKKHNIVFTGKGGCGYGRVFTDPNETDVKKKFKLIYNDKGLGGATLAYSRDGRRWNIEKCYGFIVKPDCYLNVLYDKSRKKWQLIARPRVMAEMYLEKPTSKIEQININKYTAMRRIAITESSDLLNWSRTREVLRTDEIDDITELDNMSAFVYGNKILAFVNCFTENTNKFIGQRFRPYLAFSDDAYHWDRLPVRKPITDYGRKGDFDDCLVSISGYPTKLGASNSIYTYYCGYTWENDPWTPMQTAIGILIFRKDGFVERCADENGGSLVTKEFMFEGNQLEINCRCGGPKSYMVVEIIEFTGTEMKKIKGFTWDECDPIISNVEKYIVKWEGDSNLECLRGKNVYLRFYMQNAGLYSFTVNDVNI